MDAQLLAVFGDDLMVVNCARVSMAKWHDEFDEDTDVRLLKYMAKEGHWSPFSHPKAQFRVTLPIFIARQWEKHRVGTVRGYDLYDQNEMSRRYVDDTPTFFRPEDWRARPEGNIKQGSGGPLPAVAQASCEYDRMEVERTALAVYRRMIELGVAPEQARMLLPQSTMTTWIETGSLLYWHRLCQLRLDPHAQLEIQHLARMVNIHMEAAFPVCWAAMNWVANMERR